MCVSVCVYIYMYVHIYVCTYIYIYIYIYISISVREPEVVRFNNTILASPILCGVWHTRVGSVAVRILRNGRAIVLQ